MYTLPSAPQPNSPPMPGADGAAQRCTRAADRHTGKAADKALGTAEERASADGTG